MPSGVYQLKSYNVIVRDDTIDVEDISVDKDLYKKFYDGDEMRRVAFTLSEIHTGTDKIARKVPDFLAQEIQAARVL